ncbi:uncharacterized protein LOC120894885 [Anopheles arabiensis]|uniref:Uncharacterized protein n=1 Tax=Anopheles arabiensis TaxID=7173 RepID=A0A2C9GQI3_ANOAR|nr:uncharacterized protein LOC120894885 [Anopheles arabiensis]
MSWHSGEDSGTAMNYASYGVGSSSVSALKPVQSSRMDSTQDTQEQYQLLHEDEWPTSSFSNATSYSKPSMDIQLLNDDHEKAILRDLCKSGGSESTPLTTFSYISEYICSNNIDIWPGEIASSSEASAKQELDHGEQRLPISGCIHQQVYMRCKRVLESIIVRNEQILAMLRQKSCQKDSIK